MQNYNYQKKAQNDMNNYFRSIYKEKYGNKV